MANIKASLVLRTEVIDPAIRCLWNIAEILVDLCTTLQDAGASRDLRSIFGQNTLGNHAGRHGPEAGHFPPGESQLE